MPLSRFCRWNSPIGTLVIAENGRGITELFLGEIAPVGSREETTPLLREAVQQLTDYFSGTRRDFSLPLCLHGTPFQLADWEALCSIPYGETRSYRQIAEQIGNPKACRAVGMANHRNPIAVIVPCHRVIAADGSLGGYGYGPEVKRFLLELEKRHAG